MAEVEEEEVGVEVAEEKEEEEEEVEVEEEEEEVTGCCCCAEDLDLRTRHRLEHDCGHEFTVNATTSWKPWDKNISSDCTLQWRELMVLDYAGGFPPEFRDRDLQNKPYDGQIPPGGDDFVEHAVDWIEVAQELSGVRGMSFPILKAWESRQKQCPSTEVTPLVDLAVANLAAGSPRLMAKEQFKEYSMLRHLLIGILLQSSPECDCKYHSVMFIIYQEIMLRHGECIWVSHGSSKVLYTYAA